MTKPLSSSDRRRSSMRASQAGRRENLARPAEKGAKSKMFLMCTSINQLSPGGHRFEIAQLFTTIPWRTLSVRKRCALDALEQQRNDRRQDDSNKIRVESRGF